MQTFISPSVQEMERDYAAAKQSQVRLSNQQPAISPLTLGERLFQEWEGRLNLGLGRKHVVNRAHLYGLSDYRPTTHRRTSDVDVDADAGVSCFNAHLVGRIFSSKNRRECQSCTTSSLPVLPSVLFPHLSCPDHSIYSSQGLVHMRRIGVESPLRRSSCPAAARGNHSSAGGVREGAFV